MFQYKCLMFGINSASEIFQRILQRFLFSCPNSLNYIDAIILSGQNEEQQDIFQNKVLQVLKNQSLVLNNKKCQFEVCQLNFLGHVLTSSGIRPYPNKMEVIRNFRSLAHKEEVRSFLDLVTDFGKFIFNLANLTEPLRAILKEIIWRRSLMNWRQHSKVLVKNVVYQHKLTPNFDATEYDGYTGREMNWHYTEMGKPLSECKEVTRNSISTNSHIPRYRSTYSYVAFKSLAAPEEEHRTEKKEDGQNPIPKYNL